jgi:hypothetical protein
MVRVYFKNGNQADLPNATAEVRDEIACRDSSGNVVARFQADDIVGWAVLTDEPMDVKPLSHGVAQRSQPHVLPSEGELK